MENAGTNNLCLKVHKDSGKPVKRAPLVEFKRNPLEKAACQEGNGPSRLHLISGKKRTEQFQIFADQNIAAKEDKNGSKSVGGDEENVAKGEKLALELELSPGKENKAPAKSEVKQSPNYERSFDGSSSSSSNFESGGDESDNGGEGTKSEYLTAKSSLSFLSSKSALLEKNLMYQCYEKDIYSWMLHRERLHRPRIAYMSKQSEINEEMRRMMVDWYVDVAGEFELSRSSYFLSVSLTDRALSKIDCPRDRLQLLGATAILIATKMQEVFPPQVKDIVYLTEDSFTEDQVRRMEKVLLKVVDFHLNNPLVDSFAEFFDHLSPVPLCPMARHLMWYLLELSTLEFQSIRFLPSRLAAAAFFLSSLWQAKLQQKEGGGQGELEGKIWPNEMVDRMQIRRAELLEPVKMLAKLHQDALESKSHSAVHKKYAGPKRCRVAAIKVPGLDEFASQFEDD